MARNAALEAPLELKIRGLVSDTDRHGNIRYYYRHPGRKKVRLREAFGSDAFREELRCAELGTPYRNAAPDTGPRSPAAKPGTLKWLSLEYLRRGCVDHGEGTLAHKRGALTAICDTPIEGKQTTYAEMPFVLFAETDAEYLRDLKIDTPEAANYRVKVLRSMFSWARRAKGPGGQRLVRSNPVAEVQKFRRSSDGFHTWTLDEVRQYSQRHPPGSNADLALRIYLFTGLRLADGAKVGRQHRYALEVTLEDGTIEAQHRIRYKPRKTSLTTGVEIDILILPPLLQALDALPRDRMTFLQSKNGRPYTEKSIGNMMRKWCDQAKLPQCSAHGLRKALASIAAEGGATNQQLMAMFAWTTSRQADAYTRAAERRRLATEGAKHLKLIS